MSTVDDIKAGVALEFKVNGKAVSVTVGPFVTLATVLRDELGLTGTKLGCEAGDCGACTVLLDDQQVCSCLVPAGQLPGTEIVTVEHDDPVLNLLRDSFLAMGAAQCGICTPGMLMSAADLLGRDTQPSRGDVEAAIGGTLCRCTGYVRIVDAILDAASRLETGQVEAPDSADKPQPAPVVGTSIPRVDGLAKLTGAELYAADTAPADALWLRLVRSPYAHAAFDFGDLQQVVQRHAGLLRILTAKDVPGHNGFGIYPDIKEQPVLASSRALYRGEPVLALVGDRETVEALDWQELPIQWDVLDALDEPDQALADDAPLLHADRPGNILIEGRAEKGDLQAIEDAELISVANRCQTAFVEHGYIEPEAGFAQRVGDRVEVFATTQAPMMDLEEVANVLGIEQSQVRIIPSACGGGFGGKLDVSVQPILAVATWLLNRPVRMVYNRVESMVASTKRHPANISVDVAADKTGKLQAFRMRGDFNTGAYASWGPTVAGRVPLHCTGPYAVPNVDCHTRAIHTNGPPSGAFRGFGTPQAAITRELAYDKLADELNIDRWEFRHLNAFRVGDVTPSGQQLNASVGMTQCLDALHNDWRDMLVEAERFNHKRGDALKLGVGIACMWYGCGNTGLSNPSSMRVTLNADGRCVFYNGAVDIGQGSTTVLLQICADAVGLPVEQFDLVLGDTDLTDDAGKTSASRQTFVSGKAAMLAGLDLRRQLLDLLGANAEATLSIDGDTLQAKLDFTELQYDLSRHRDAGVVVTGSGVFDPPITPLDAKGQGKAYATYAFAAQICTVEIDTALGTVKPRRFVAAHDVGRAINPQLVSGQIHGGIMQGLGMALMEEYLPGRTDNLHDYLIPTAGDVPDIDIHLVEAEEPLGPYGAKGVGEPALVPTPAAILSAIRHATGITMERVPVLPHRLSEHLNMQLNQKLDRESSHGSSHGSSES